MTMNIKSLQNLVSVEHIDEGRKAGSIKQSLWRHLLPVLLLPLIIGVSWSTVAAQTRAYVTNINTNTVSVINTEMNTEITTVPVGSRPIALAVTPDGTQVYVANQNSGSVSVINTATNNVTTIAVGIGPSGVAINGTLVYVTNQGSDTVSVIDTTNNTVIATIPVGVAPFGVAVSRDGTRVYVTNLVSNSVSVIDTATNNVTTIPVGIRPFALAISPDGTRAYVANSGSDNVSVINTTDNTVIATIPVGDDPIAVAISPDGRRVYVANQSSHSVSVINTANNTVITVPVGFFPSGLAVSPDGTRLFVTNQGSGNVSVINTVTNTVIATIFTSGSCPFGIVITTPPGTGGGTTAASVSVSGRVITPQGRGIRNVVITMTDSQGNSRTATTTSFGYYRFEEVAAGETFIFAARGKRFTFEQNSQVHSIMENTNNINFVADEQTLISVN